MELHRILVLEIEKFECWEQPWSFYKTLSASSALDDDARELLRSLWVEVIECPSWRAGKALENICSLADARLESRFPWLSEKARGHLVNAASYQWR